MKEFAALLDKLSLIASRNKKIGLLSHYFTITTDPDRGIALAILTGNLSFKNIKSSQLKQIAYQHIDEHLFKLSYDYVGDLGETVALIWPYYMQGKDLPSLSKLIDEINETKKKDIPELIEHYLTIAENHERWALIKLITGGLRIGVSARLAKTALAKMGNQNLQDIEEIWHGLKPPYLNLFKWLEGKAEKPEIKHTETFHPLMLSNPIEEHKDFEKLDPSDFQAEWKWDGIRVQLVIDESHKTMFSRTGDDISHTFPDLIESLKGRAVLDGELLVGEDLNPMPFNNLQQRLNRKTVSPKLMKDYPAFVNIYDILFHDDEDVRSKSLQDRRQILEKWFENNKQPRLALSEKIDFKDWQELERIRVQGADENGHEGVMIKHKSSPYIPGRPKGIGTNGSGILTLLMLFLCMHSVVTESVLLTILIIRLVSGKEMRLYLLVKLTLVLPMRSLKNWINLCVIIQSTALVLCVKSIKNSF